MAKTLIFKYYGGRFYYHQEIANVGAASDYFIDFVSPYLLSPSKNAGGEVIIDFLEHNPNTNLW